MHNRLKLSILCKTPRSMPAPHDTQARVRLDKWLWAARFFKTRGLSSDEIDKGRILVNGQTAKPSKEPRVGDTIEVRQAQVVRTVVVRALSSVRGPAPVAALLYEETAESIQQRQAAAESRREAPEPSLSLTQGRPTKRDRRDMQALRNRPPPSWDDRWSASLDD
jgi:ribosome-associated heat shock protein Hsp15